MEGNLYRSRNLRAAAVASFTHLMATVGQSLDYGHDDVPVAPGGHWHEHQDLEGLLEGRQPSCSLTRTSQHQHHHQYQSFSPHLKER